jgi:predicted nucleotidyltransferase
MGMSPALQEILSNANARYAAEGFVILGIFGSRARGDNKPDSDLDILYRLSPEFLERYPGWNSTARVDEIKHELAELIGLDIDLADRDALRPLAQRFILPETLYVA